MNLLFDEDVGPSAPTAMRALGMDVSALWVRKVWKKQKLIPDEQWIPWAARNDYIVISRNIRILLSETQRNLAADCGLGIVFLYPHGGSPLNMFLLLQRKWKLLTDLYEHEPRPFAWVFPMSGHKPYRDDRIPADYHDRTRAELLEELIAKLGYLPGRHD